MILKSLCEWVFNCQDEETFFVPAVQGEQPTLEVNYPEVVIKFGNRGWVSLYKDNGIVYYNVQTELMYDNSARASNQQEAAKLFKELIMKALMQPC